MSEDTTQDMNGSRSFEDRIMARFDAMEARMDKFDLRLTSLEEKVDRRLMETRPIWEAVQAQLEELNEKFDKLNDKFDLVTSDLYDMRARSSRLTSA